MFWRVLYDFQVGPHKGTFYKTVSYIKNIENVPLQGPKKIFKILFCNSIHVITTICKVYGALLINLLIPIVHALMKVVLFFVPLQEQALT